MFGERSTAKNVRSVGLLSVVCKVFEKLLNNRIVDHLEKCLCSELPRQDVTDALSKRLENKT